MAEIFHYPSDLDALVTACWPVDLPPAPFAECRRAVLEVAYHASMLREEGRPVRARVALARPSDLRSSPPPSQDGLLVLRLDRTRPFDVDELRRLSIAAPFETSMIAIAPDEHGELRIWGIVATGAQWLAPTWGGRRRGGPTIPGCAVHVRGPARISVHAGERFVAGLEGGRLITLRTDVFESRWMPELFAGARDELVRSHDVRRLDDGHGDWPAIHGSLVIAVSQQMVRRALWLMREAHHGGTLLFVEPDDADELLSTVLRAKYRFAEGAARTRYRKLLRGVTGVLSEARGARSPTLGAGDFLHHTGTLTDLEAAIFELSRTIAWLSAVDGAVVLSKRFELLAFGVEIANASTGPRRIYRALDTEGEQTVDDDEENVGTRHRAAYRFVQAHPRGLAIVVSQDGTIRFVACREGHVTYYEQHVAG